MFSKIYEVWCVTQNPSKNDSRMTPCDFKWGLGPPYIQNIGIWRGGGGGVVRGFRISAVILWAFLIGIYRFSYDHHYFGGCSFDVVLVSDNDDCFGAWYFWGGGEGLNYSLWCKRAKPLVKSICESVHKSFFWILLRWTVICNQIWLVRFSFHSYTSGDWLNSKIRRAIVWRQEPLVMRS